ncbi:MAG TPA: polysaccharide deacetylase family protein [Sediminibacterium sp.]|nr:polysaccharide deacetylase family protein [Sediminibacterium sp.]
MIRHLSACFLVCAGMPLLSIAQADPHSWNGHQSAVVLTYDDAVDIDLDHVAPALDSFGLKGTFYLIGSSPSISRRMQEWKKLAAEGHELGNHTSFHPCDSRKPGRGFVKPDTDLSRYSLSRMTAETRFTNTLLAAMDGDSIRTFAFPCGDKTIHDTPYYPLVQKAFIAARGVTAGMETIDQVNLDDVKAYSIQNQPGSYLIDLVNQAIKSNSLLVFLFHGVGGGHAINESSAAHRELLNYLYQHRQEVWTTTLRDVALYIRAQRKRAGNPVPKKM